VAAAPAIAFNKRMPWQAGVGFDCLPNAGATSAHHHGELSLPTAHNPD
jgi:hypothetical protein